MSIGFCSVNGGFSSSPKLKEEELVKQEKKDLGVGVTEVIMGGFLWGKPLVKRGMNERYAHLLKLSSRFPDGEVKNEILESLAVFKDVAGKLGDESLKDLPIPPSPSAGSLGPSQSTGVSEK